MRRAAVAAVLLGSSVTGAVVAMDAPARAPVFSYYGYAYLSDGITAAPAGYTVRIENLSLGETYTGVVGDVRAGQYDVVAVRTDSTSAGSAGDSVRVTLANASESPVSGPVIRVLTAADITAGGIEIDLRVHTNGVRVVAPPGQLGVPGVEMFYVFEIWNVGLSADSVSILATSGHPSWISTHPAQRSLLPFGGVQPVVVGVTVPAGQTGRVVENVTVEACSLTDPSECSSDSTQLASPVAVADRRVEWTGSAVEVSWRFPGGRLPVWYRLDRRANGAVVASDVGNPALRTGGWAVARDTAVRLGMTYAYELRYAYDDREAPRVVRIGTVSVPMRDEVLKPNYPNPFNPRTTLSFDLPRPARVELTVYDIGGRRVRTLIGAEVLGPAAYRREWNGENESGEGVGSGVYIARLVVDGRHYARKMLLLK